MMTHPCPCGSSRDYLSCCGPYLNNQAFPKTPEALMRSRYSAYTMANMAYIKATMRGKPLLGFDEIDAARFAKSVEWLGLTVLSATKDPRNKNRGFVTFIATYKEMGAIKTIQEKSQFKFINGRWYYTDST